MFPDFVEFIASLNVHRVRYLIVGGYAVAFHARPRATKDVDVWIDRTTSNAKRAQAALAAFLGETIAIERLLDERTVLVLGRSPVRIDVLTSLEGLSFAKAWRGRVEATFGEEHAAYLGLSDLILVKEIAGRPIDREDVRVLRRVLARGASKPAGRRRER